MTNKKSITLALFSILATLSVNAAHAEKTVNGKKESAHKAVVLMYHQVGYKNNDMSVTPELFQSEIDYLHQNNYNVISTTDFVKDIQQKANIPAKTVVITFDDGWYSQKTALDMLEKYHYPAQLGLITEYQTMRSPAYFQEKEIKDYIHDQEFTFVNHSHTHVMKDFLDNPVYDVKISKEEMIKNTGKFVPIYVYPYGKRNVALVDQLKKNGYIAAYGVYGEPVDVKKIDIFNINRYLMNNTVDLKKFEDIVSKAK